jgi:hypothetical protein
MKYHFTYITSLKNIVVCHFIVSYTPFHLMYVLFIEIGQKIKLLEHFGIFKDHSVYNN